MMQTGESEGRNGGSAESRLYKKSEGEKKPYYLDLPEREMVYVNLPNGSQVGIFAGKDAGSVTVWDMEENLKYHILTQQRLKVSDSGKESRGYVNK